VKILGYTVKVRYFIGVIDAKYAHPEIGLDAKKVISNLCQSYNYSWKISQNSSDFDSAGNSLSALFAAAQAGGKFASPQPITIGLGSLDGAVVAQATGSTITLDTNAAGHGWFVDTTPNDNEEFLATSDPNIWIARAGSAADGKMDMLSVLLHEYGHVLGLDHSADTGDAMSAVLQPGVRKLWSETELAKMNEIIALQSTPFDQLPADFPVDYPSNGLPPGQTRASTPVARRPRRNPADVNIDLLSDAKIEALNAINPTLTGGDLLSPQGWETTGAVNIANGHATLAETARSQSRLTQGFVLSSQDRYLSFTVEGLQMTDSTVGPDDAFEVALLNANTRAALTSTVALTRSDALLNIQANGTERRSDKLRRIDNADGSRTYVLDLLGVGTADPVALSFDLIGLGLNGHEESAVS
jgi:Matrixin